MHILDAGPDQAIVKRVDIPFGQTMYLCYVPAYSSPVGFAWGIGNARGVFEVAGSLTEPWARRQGVRTRINEAILRDFQVIRTNYGSDEGGRAFMKAQGYNFSRALRCYYKTRPTKKGKK